MTPGKETAGKPGSACLITGPTGYLGSRIMSHLEESGFEAFPVTSSPEKFPGKATRFCLGDRPDLACPAPGHGATLVHCAWDLASSGRRHNLRVNVQGSRLLLESAQKAGVRRFIFLSSISAAKPGGSVYGDCKRQVEKMFLDEGGIVVRPGLVYGQKPAGLFGTMDNLTGRLPVVPLINQGRDPVYLIHEKEVCLLVEHLVNHYQANRGTIITTVEDQPTNLRAMADKSASRQGRKPIFLPVPWPLAWLGVYALELLGLAPGLRADSVRGLVGTGTLRALPPWREQVRIK